MELILDTVEKVLVSLPVIAMYRDNHTAAAVYAIQHVPDEIMGPRNKADLCMILIRVYGGLQWILVERKMVEVTPIHEALLFDKKSTSLLNLTVEKMIVHEGMPENMIHAIKVVRSMTGCSLVEAKVWVEAHDGCYKRPMKE